MLYQKFFFDQNSIMIKTLYKLGPDFHMFGIFAQFKRPPG